MTYDNAFTQLRSSLDRSLPLVSADVAHSILAKARTQPSAKLAQSTSWWLLDAGFVAAMLCIYLLLGGEPQTATVVSSTAPMPSTPSVVLPHGRTSEAATTSTAPLSKPGFANVITGSMAPAAGEPSIGTVAVRQTALHVIETKIDLPYISQPIVVTREALQRLGISISNDTVSFITRQPLKDLNFAQRMLGVFFGVMPWQDHVFTRMELTRNGVSAGPLHDGDEWRGGPEPIFSASYTNGKFASAVWGSSNDLDDSFLPASDRTMQSELSEADIARRIEKLVPVVIDLSDAKQDRKVVLWFERTAEFVLATSQTSRVDASSAPVISVPDVTMTSISSVLSSVLLRPNPTSGQDAMLLYELESNTTVTVSVYDVLGQQLWRSEATVAASGNHITHLPAAVFEEGIYTVVIQAGGETRSVRWLIRR
jgi:hypothetical protein